MSIRFARTKAPAASALPVRFAPVHDGQPLADGCAQFKDLIDAALRGAGGVLPHGFRLACVAAVQTIRQPESFLTDPIFTPFQEP